MYYAGFSTGVLISRLINSYTKFVQLFYVNYSLVKLFILKITPI